MFISRSIVKQILFSGLLTSLATIWSCSEDKENHTSAIADKVEDSDSTRDAGSLSDSVVDATSLDKLQTSWANFNPNKSETLELALATSAGPAVPQVARLDKVSAQSSEYLIDMGERNNFRGWNTIWFVDSNSNWYFRKKCDGKLSPHDYETYLYTGQSSPCQNINTNSRTAAVSATNRPVSYKGNVTLMIQPETPAASKAYFQKISAQLGLVAPKTLVYNWLFYNFPDEINPTGLPLNEIWLESREFGWVFVTSSGIHQKIGKKMRTLAHFDTNISGFHGSSYEILVLLTSFGLNRGKDPIIDLITDREIYGLNLNLLKYEGNFNNQKAVTGNCKSSSYCLGRSQNWPSPFYYPHATYYDTYENEQSYRGSSDHRPGGFWITIKTNTQKNIFSGVLTRSPRLYAQPVKDGFFEIENDIPDGATQLKIGGKIFAIEAIGDYRYVFFKSAVFTASKIENAELLNRNSQSMGMVQVAEAIGFLPFFQPNVLAFDSEDAALSVRLDGIVPEGAQLRLFGVPCSRDTLANVRKAKSLAVSAHYLAAQYKPPFCFAKKSELKNMLINASKHLSQGKTALTLYKNAQETQVPSSLDGVNQHEFAEALVNLIGRNSRPIEIGSILKARDPKSRFFTETGLTFAHKYQDFNVYLKDGTFLTFYGANIAYYDGAKYRILSRFSGKIFYDNDKYDIDEASYISGYVARLLVKFEDLEASDQFSLVPYALMNKEPAENNSSYISTNAIRVALLTPGTYPDFCTVKFDDTSFKTREGCSLNSYDLEVVEKPIAPIKNPVVTFYFGPLAVSVNSVVSFPKNYLHFIDRKTVKIRGMFLAQPSELEIEAELPNNVKMICKMYEQGICLFPGPVPDYNFSIVVRMGNVQKLKAVYSSGITIESPFYSDSFTIADLRSGFSFYDKLVNVQKITVNSVECLLQGVKNLKPLDGSGRNLVTSEGCRLASLPSAQMDSNGYANFKIDIKYLDQTLSSSTHNLRYKFIHVYRPSDPLDSSLGKNTFYSEGHSKNFDDKNGSKICQKVCESSGGNYDPKLNTPDFCYKYYLKYIYLDPYRISSHYSNFHGSHGSIVNQGCIGDTTRWGGKFYENAYSTGAVATTAKLPGDVNYEVYCPCRGGELSIFNTIN